MFASEHLPFTKMEGAGNDFLVLDARGVPAWSRRLGSLVPRWCDRRRGVGADGVLLLLEPPPGDPAASFTMLYLNADGSRGEFCGNGARSLALWAARRGLLGPEGEFLTDAGRIRARVAAGEGRVALAMPPVQIVRADLDLEAAGRRWRGVWVQAGVPHAVFAVEDSATLDRLDVAAVGRTLRHHAAFGPPGANADFVAPGAAPDGGPPLLLLRTYERGVEAETLACGSGSVASAAAWVTGQPTAGERRVVHVAARSGDRLTIRLRPTGGGAFDQVELEGPAREVFEGVLPLEGA